MQTTSKYILFLLIPAALAVICLQHSESVMNGYQDCTSYYGFLHTLPNPSLPPNCADNQILGSHVMFQFCGAGLSMITVGAAIVLYWKERHPAREGIEHLKIAE